MKAAVNSLTMGAANAFAGTNVRVNAVLPGLVETKLTKATFDYARAKGSESKMGALTPLRRTGRAEEIAAVAAFLASDDSAYIDGQLIAADGGISSTHPFGRFVL
jgi:NAD(P)-dependent dehydrogenase (short-subunit alcohol dehydrogenase family)